jgi:hypothetical protein
VPWLAEYLHEMTVFPKGKHDDQVDSTAQFLDWFKKPFPSQAIFELYRRQAEQLQQRTSLRVLLRARVLVRPVEARARQQLGIAAVETGVHAIAVVLYLMQPLQPLGAKFPASWENTGNFADSGLGSASDAAKKGTKSVSYEPIPYASEQGIFLRLTGN